jgi:hypothetical protein
MKKQIMDKPEEIFITGDEKDPNWISKRFQRELQKKKDPFVVRFGPKIRFVPSHFLDNAKSLVAYVYLQQIDI